MPTEQVVDNLFIVAARNHRLYSNRSGGREMKTLPLFVLSVILLVLMAACAPGSSIQVTTPESSMQLSAPGPNPLVNQPDATGRIARAGAGLWHGIIAPITLVLSFFNSDLQMYEVHNAGSEYNLGFLFGVAIDFAILGLLLRMRR
jgi:hypothetical protein